MIHFAQGLVLAFAVLTGAAEAQSVKLRGAEIDILLSGNTAVGISEGIEYRQFFGEDGSTIVARENAEPEHGEWRVEGEEYQSRWSGEETWTGWFVMEYASQWYWVSKSTPPTQFEVQEGDQLVAK